MTGVEEPGNDPPFGIVMLAFCLVLVQLAVAVAGRHPVLWVLATIDFGLAFGLWRAIAWVRWATFVRCAALLILFAVLASTGGKVGFSWPPVAVAVFGAVVLWLPSSRRWFQRPSLRQAR